MRYTIFDTPILNTLLRWQALVLLRIFGWRRQGQLPDISKYVVIAAPHTTNWELPIALAMAFSFRIKVSWMGKDSLFRWPFGMFFRWLGGIPVERTRSTGLVARSIQAFRENERFVLILAPEGTRSRTGTWRSGFYHIAAGAGVPIAMGFVDFRRKVAGIGPALLTPTGDIDADMRIIRTFYAGVTGKHPDNSSQAAVEARTG